MFSPLRPLAERLGTTVAVSLGIVVRARLELPHQAPTGSAFY